MKKRKRGTTDRQTSAQALVDLSTTVLPIVTLRKIQKPQELEIFVQTNSSASNLELLEKEKEKDYNIDLKT